VVVALNLTALELKEPTAWPTKFALIAEATRIARLVTHGVVTELPELFV